jgi:cytochrome c peroxidase
MIRARVLVSSITALVLLGCPAQQGADKSTDAKAKPGADKTDKTEEAGDDGFLEKAEGTELGSAYGTWTFIMPKGLSEPPAVPPDNPMTAKKLELGHQLFMDKRLSGDGSRSCYSCHQNELGNADGRPLALGAGDKPLTRNTPTIWNVGYHANGLYWDGRSASLEAQAIGALEGGNMGVGKDNMAAKAKEIGALPEYAKQFAEVFELAPGTDVLPEHIAKALSAYERNLLCGNTAFDEGKLSEAAQRGWDLFRGKASCTTCHAGDNFTDGAYHNVGISHDETGALRPDADIGRGKVSDNQADNYKFRTPTLRNVAQTAPYFHNGSVATLEEAVRYMVAGGNAKAPGIDQNLRNTALTDAEIGDLVEFLRALDCPGSLLVIGDQTVAGISVPMGGG